jgi:hypothetical protein
MLKYAVPRTFLTLTVMAFTCFGQNLPVQEPSTKPAEQVQEAAGNQEVLDLLKSGMSAGVIIAKIKASTAKFDSSPTALQALKAAGAVDEVILAIIELLPAPSGVSRTSSPPSSRNFRRPL